MIAIQRQILSSNNHAWHNKIYNIPIEAVNIRAPILLNKLDANRHECEHDEKSNTLILNNKVELCNRTVNNPALLNGNTSFLFIFSGQDKHLRRILPDEMIMIVSSRNVTARYLKLFIGASTSPNSCPSIPNTLAISTTVTSKIDISNLPSESVEMTSDTMQCVFDELLKPHFLKAQSCASKPKNRIELLTNWDRYAKNTSLIKSSFMKLVSLYNYAVLAVNETMSKNVLSVYQRNWHIRDLLQGFLLTALLKHCDMASLNITKKPFFVIITRKTINNSVSLKFNLSNHVPKAYDFKPFENSSIDFTQWNDEHVHILDTSSYNFRVFKFYKTYDASTESDDLECKINSSYGSASSITLYPTDERINIEVESRNSSDVYTKDSEKSYSMSSFNEITNDTQINLKKCRGTTNISKTPRMPLYLYNAILRLTKYCFRKVVDKTTPLKVFLGIPYLNPDRIINESIFESTVISAFTFKISQVWIEYTQQICYSVFLKCLGLNSICNMCTI